MYSYRVISEAGGVPEMSDLEAIDVHEPTRQFGGFIVLSFPYPDPFPYEPGVGKRCRVIRSRDGHSEECGGVVQGLSPTVRVSLDGAGWK